MRGHTKDKNMKEQILKLKERYHNAKTQAELDAIELEMSTLAEVDNDEFSEAMVKLAHETATEAKELVIRQQLKDVLPMVSLSYIAKTYFGKSKEWLYQRINGNMVNGKPAKFTPQEISVLNDAFKNMGNTLLDIRVS